MKHQTLSQVLLLLLLFGVATVCPSPARAQDGHDSEPESGLCRFVDEDGDGFNDLAPDHDGDGIPNGLDPDFQPPASAAAEGEGRGFGYMFGWLDELFGRYAAWEDNENGHMFGVRDGSGTGFGPAEGTGFGPGAGDGGNGQGSAGEGAGGPGGFGGNGSGGSGGHGNGGGSGNG